MMEEDPPRRPTGFMPPVLDGWDVEDLRRYVAALRAEIARVEAAMARKEAYRGAADQFFRKPPG